MSKKSIPYVFWIITISSLIFIARYNYLLFHTSAETFSIIIACGVFMFAWNARKFIENHYLLFIGIAYLFIGMLDLLHTLSYKGMGVFPKYDSNFPTQLRRIPMKSSFYTAIFIICIFILYPLTGCGSGEDRHEMTATEPAEHQIEKKEKVPVAEDNIIKIAEHTPAPSDISLQDMINTIKDEIIIENAGYETDRKKAVRFSHKKHIEEYGVVCVKCHHLYQDGVNKWKDSDPVDKCSACHDPVTDKEGVMKLQNAFHKNCKDCHKEVNNEGKNAPDKKCTECHSQ